MSNGDELDDYEIGYGKPPKSGRFKKGISGNPSGRPKKPSDFASELKKELNAKVIIHENGKRKVITKDTGIRRQVVNKALSGNLPAVRQVDDWKREAKEMFAEQVLNSRNGSDVDPKPEEMTDEELLMCIQGIHPKYSLTKCPNCGGSLK
jgi:hypothetical protein